MARFLLTGVGKCSEVMLLNQIQKPRCLHTLLDLLKLSV